MDVMSLRRGLMTIGGIAMVGEFSKFASVKVTPSEMNNIEIANPLQVAPKLVLVKCDSLTVNNKIQYAVVWADGGCGGCLYTAATSNKGSLYYTTDYATASATQGTAYIGADKIHIHCVTSTRNWDIYSEYTVELYA